MNGTGRHYLGKCVVCLGGIDDPSHIRLGDLIAHEYCRDYVKAERVNALEAGRMDERLATIQWLRGIGNGKLTHPSLRDWILAPSGLALSIERAEHRAT